jgi:O-antigen/teichoic acid export membrane protein
MIKNKLTSFILNKKKTNFFIYGFGQVFNLLSPLVVAPKIILICGESGFGKVGLAFAFCLFLMLIVDYAFDIKGTKEVSENRNSSQKLQKILNTAIFTKLILFVFALLISVTLIFSIDFFNQERDLFLFALTIVFAQVFNPVWFLQGIENFKLVSFLNIFSKTIYVILVFCLVNHKNDYIFVNFFLGISSFIFNFFGLLVIKRKYNFQIILPNYLVVRKIIQNDFSFCVSQLFLSVRQLSPLVLTSFFLGFSIAGQYKIIEQIISLCRTFLQVFLKFFYSSACLKYINNPQNGLMYWKKYSLISASIISFFLLGIFLFSDQVLRFFQLSDTAIFQLSILFKISLLVSLLMAVTLPLEQLMFIKEKHAKYIKTTIFVTLVNIALIVFFVNQFQLKAIVFSLIIAELLFILFYYIFTKATLKSKF